MSFENSAPVFPPALFLRPRTPGVTMFVSMRNRWIAGRELVRHEHLRLDLEQSLLAKFHRDLRKVAPAVAYGELDCLFGSQRPQRRRSRVRGNGSSQWTKMACLYPIFPPRARPFTMEKPAPVAVTIRKATICSKLYPADESILYVFSIVFFGIIHACNANRGFLYDSMPN